MLCLQVKQNVMMVDVDTDTIVTKNRLSAVSSVLLAKTLAFLALSIVASFSLSQILCFNVVSSIAVGMIMPNF